MTTPTPTHHASAPFTSRPQQYPKAQRKAAEVLTQFQRLVAKAPRSLIGTVIDTSYQASMGYVLSTTQLGVVQVHGVPYGSVVPQMRIFVRQLGPSATNRHFVFDGFAPALSSRSLTSGSMVSTMTNGDSGTVLAATTTGGMPSSASLATSAGYYWHFFFYIPTLPSIPRVTLFTMGTSGATNVVACEYLSSGQLVFRCTNDSTGYITIGAIAPHVMHWVQVQPGLAGSLELLVDGVASYTTLTAIPTFSGAATTYTGSFLSKSDGSQQCPVGTWISRFGYGYSYASSAPVALSTGQIIPTDDSQVPALGAGGTMQTQTLYLCTDTPGSGSIANSAPSGGTGSALSLSTLYANVMASGPY